MTTTITITPPSDIKDLAAFLENMNNDSSSHVGYCGEDREGIYQTLLDDFSDLDLSQSFAVAYDNGSIVGAIGLDIDKDRFSAEVWGPFISDKIDDSYIVDKLLKTVISNSSIQLKHLSFFLNKENTRGKEFVLKHGELKEDIIPTCWLTAMNLGKLRLKELWNIARLMKKPFLLFMRPNFLVHIIVRKKFLVG